jgi:hypothetical protein
VDVNLDIAAYESMRNARALPRYLDVSDNTGHYEFTVVFAAQVPTVLDRYRLEVAPGTSD